MFFFTGLRENRVSLFSAAILFSCCLVLNREAVKTSKQTRQTIGGASSP